MAFPNSLAAKDVHRLALSYLSLGPEESSKMQGIKGFISKWLKRGK
jgi:flagellar biosynthesis protein FlhG